MSSTRLQKIAVIVLVGIAVVQGVVAVFLKLNDFDVHLTKSAGFGRGEPYAEGMETYPLARVMFNWLLSKASDCEVQPGAYLQSLAEKYPWASDAINHYMPRIPKFGVRAVAYVLALFALLAVFRMWRQIAQGRESVPLNIDYAAGMLAVFLLLPYVLRDLDECGLQIFLLFFLSAAGFALVRGKPILSGFWLGTAIQYKVAPLLFVPFLIWKRQWRATFATAGFVVLWGLAPALFLGMDATIKAHREWFDTIAKVNTTKEAYPSLQEREAPKPQNLSLMAVLARYLETYPQGHPLHLDHPWFRQFGNLEPTQAFYAVRGILLAACLLLAWRWRHGWQSGNLSSNLPGEWACVTMLASLLAPQCWKQHLVVVLPAAFLVLRHELANQSWMRWRFGVFAAIAALVVCGRQELVGRELAIVLMSYKLDSFASLATMAMTLLLPRPKPTPTAVVEKVVRTIKRAA